MDSIPIVAITGQVSTTLIGKDVFQEVDITGATAPFTKHNYLVKDSRSSAYYKGGIPYNINRKAVPRFDRYS